MSSKKKVIRDNFREGVFKRDEVAVKASQKLGVSY